MTADKPRLIVYRYLTELENGDVRSGAERARSIAEWIQEIRADFRKLELAVLPEDVFLDYGNPLFAEDTEASRAFVKFIRKEFRLDRNVAEFDALDIYRGGNKTH